MTHFHFPLICATALLVLVAAQFAQPAAARSSSPTIPGVKRSLIDCDVTADQLTANCGYRPSIYWKRARAIWRQ